MSLIYKIEIINLTYRGQDTELEAVIEFKINGDHKRMSVPEKDIMTALLDKASHLGINKENYIDMMSNTDPKYKFENEFLTKYIEIFFRV